MLFRQSVIYSGRTNGIFQGKRKSILNKSSTCKSEIRKSWHSYGRMTSWNIQPQDSPALSPLPSLLSYLMTAPELQITIQLPVSKLLVPVIIQKGKMMENGCLCHTVFEIGCQSSPAFGLRLELDHKLSWVSSLLTTALGTSQLP